MKKVRENGIDGFWGLVSFIGLAVACFIIWLATGLATSWLIATLLYVAMASCFLYTTLIGKQKIWDQQLPQITLSTDTRALDIGCGHGMVLFKIAHRLPAGGHITGIDIWRQQDQTGASLEQAAADVGFGDYSNFYRAFRREYGITPASYRQLVRQ